MGELSRLTGVVWSPGAAFRDIAARPRWWPPLVLLALVSMIFMYSFTQRVGWERFFRQQAETNSRMQSMPADQREQAVAAQIKIGPVFAYVAAVVALPIMALATAGVFLFLFRTAFSATLSFRQSFAIVYYSFIPLLFGSIMALVVMLLKNPEDFDLNYPTLTNIGAFLDQASTPKWLLSLGTSIDVFSLWTLVLLATGFAAAGRKISWGSSFACVLGTWAVYVVLKVGLASIFS
jgi:Yip1 domain